MGRPITGPLGSYPPVLVNLIYKLRDENSGWGAKTILVELEEAYSYSKSDLPGIDTIRLYLKEQGFISPKIIRGILPEKTDNPQVKQVHDLWELDAQGAVRVPNIGFISMINIKDAHSKTYVMSFPVQVSGTKSQPKTLHYLWALRLAFEQFGFPKCIQVDRDSVFIDSTSQSPFPSQFYLFLISLGIELSFINVRPPSKQAMVERSHQTMDKQALTHKGYTCWQNLFTNTNRRRRIMNEKYPSRTLGQKAPLQVYPEARIPLRPYSIETESKLMCFKKVENFLAQCKWIRRVSKDKTLSLAGKVYYLKKAQKRTEVSITFCPKMQKLIFRDVNELIIQELQVINFAQNVLKLDSTEKLKKIKKSLFQSRQFPLE